MLEVGLGVGLFSLIVISLVLIILGAKSKLVASGDVELVINEEKTIYVPVGSKLLTALADAHLFVSSACGGGGTCAQCRVKVFEGGGEILPTETSLITKREALEGDRLSCQVSVKPAVIQRYTSRFTRARHYFYYCGFDVARFYGILRNSAVEL